MSHRPAIKRRLINIGFTGERYETELKSEKFKIDINGDTHKFVTDYEQPDCGCRWGRWVKEVDHVNG